ncbi:cysteine hydrolase family protein [Aurantiacibacter rhizosphaerae]|uniref:Isochorismatase family protein n=1 Tax=Aurantiacibacter rhizosphaerae TaxID=2691582 RepID=A0A844XEK4_9SPHN|nr:cysteine hydrolase [Aurantiacibacter rhizosphaerae]MWV28008.1 isochorismatase family protein [Aurantiacibacter rhizosphaerae]
MSHHVDHAAILAAHAQVRGEVGNIWQKLDPAKTAHLVVDMQNGFVAEGAPVEVPMARNVVEKINRLSRTIRSAGGKNIFLRFTTPDPDGPAAWPVFAERMLDGIAAHREAFTPGADYWQMWPEIENEGEDLLVDKHRFSGFTPGTSDLHDVLRQHGMENLIISGTLTNCCCESTARDAMQLNYRVVMAVDACAALSEEAHGGTLDSMALIFADLRTVDEIEGLLSKE